eukprot:gene9202-12412_t
MECPICYSTYCETNEPLLTFCCGRTLCITCIISLLENSSICPWDRIRWTARTAIQRHQLATPKNYLSILSNKIDNDDDFCEPKVSILGSGELREEYEQYQLRVMQENNQNNEERRHQLNNDEQLALLMEEEEEKLRYEKNLLLSKIAEEDFEIALQLAKQDNNNQTSLKSANKIKTNNNSNNSNSKLKEWIEKNQHAALNNTNHYSNNIAFSNQQIDSMDDSVPVCYFLSDDDQPKPMNDNNYNINNNNNYYNKQKSNDNCNDKSNISKLNSKKKMNNVNNNNQNGPIDSFVVNNSQLYPKSNLCSSSSSYQTSSISSISHSPLSHASLENDVNKH